MSKQKRPCPCGSGKRYRDCCYQKDLAAPPPGAAASGLWLPSLVLIGVAILVIARSFMAHNYPQRAFWVQNQTLNALSYASFAAAVLLAAVPWLRGAAAVHLERLSSLSSRRRLAWLAAGYAGLMLWFGFIRWCQYRGYLLPTDTSQSVANAHVFIRHGTLDYPLWGMKTLSQHITLIMPLFSPVLLLWDDPVPLLLLQNVFVCSLPFAAFALAFSLTASAAAGFVALWLMLSSPYLFELLTSNLHIAALPAFFAWAMYCAHRGRWGWAAALIAATLACNEQVPFIYVGLGLYLIVALRGVAPRNWLLGLGLCAAAAALWAGEVALIKHFERLEPELSTMGTSKWLLYQHLAPAGTPMGRIPAEIVSHPLQALGRLFSSVYIFYPLLRVLFSMGLLALLAPWHTLPFWTAFAPHLLANPGLPAKFFDHNPINYADFGLHHPAYILGPLVWATAHGLARAWPWLKARGREPWLLVWALAVSGFGFKYAHRTLHPDWHAPWFDAMPRVMARIPRDAAVWGDEYALTPLSARRWLKNIQWGPDDPDGYKSLFMPDYVLFDKAFVVYAKPPYRDRMLTFLARHGYLKAADDQNVLLLRRPGAPRPAGTVPERTELPAPEATLIQAYAAYLLRAPPEPS